jgi:hypothetical protein
MSADLWEAFSLRTLISNVKIQMTNECEAPRPQGGASRARSGEPDASKGNFVHIVPLDPAYKAGLAGHVPVKL